MSQKHDIVVENRQFEKNRKSLRKQDNLKI